MPYFPGTGPAVTTPEISDLLHFIEREIEAISKNFSETIVLELRPSFAPPDKPQDGEIRYADGVNWDPGSGVGIYGRVSGAWVKLS